MEALLAGSRLVAIFVMLIIAGDCEDIDVLMLNFLLFVVLWRGFDSHIMQGVFLFL